MEVLLVQLVLDLFDHGWKVMHTDLCKGKVPVIFRIFIIYGALAVTCSSIIAQPDVIACFPELDWHRQTHFTILIEPRISGHVKTVLDKNCLFYMSSVFFVIFNETWLMD